MYRCLSWRSLHRADPLQPSEAFMDLLCRPLGATGCPDLWATALSPLLCPLPWAYRDSWLCLVCCHTLNSFPYGYRIHPLTPVLHLLDPSSGNGKEKIRQMVLVAILNTEVLSLLGLSWKSFLLVNSTPSLSSSLPRAPGERLPFIHEFMADKKVSSTFGPYAGAQKPSGSSSRGLIPGGRLLCFLLVSKAQELTLLMGC